MAHNKYAILNEEYHLNYKEEEELKKALQESKKMFDKKNKKEKEINDNQLLVARLNSELSNKREQDRHIDAALIDSEKMYKSEQDMCASKQMEEDRKLGLFGDYPEINSALHRNYNSLIKIENLRKNEVIPDDFIGISGGDKFK
jgi:hypothetical protein